MPQSETLTQLIQKQFPQAFISAHNQHGDETVVVEKSAIVAICQFLRDDPRCKMEIMMDLTAVDHLPRQPRFEMVYHLKSLSLNQRLRLKVPIAEEDCSIDSLHALWLSVDWYERECAEMYGIRFNNHPNLINLLLYPEFKGFPLRKDYPIDKQHPLVDLIQVEERYDYRRH